MMTDGVAPRGVADQKTVVVLGLARSGTSVTTGVLEALGVDMGPPSWPTDWNPKGNFEDESFGKLHKAILNAAEPGKTYFDPPARERLLAQQEKFAKPIQTLIAEKSDGKPLWGWKHPDTIMMIDLYMPYHVNPRFVMVFRNPVGTAQSTVEHTRRFQDKVEFDRALKLVHYYNGEMLRFIDAHPELPKLYVAFEDLVENPLREARRMADFISVELTEKKMRQVERLVIPREKIADEKTRAKTLVGGKIPRLVKQKLLPLFRPRPKIQT